jgi:Regulator of chromosome condensation (RCC1) repeat
MRRRHLLTLISAPHAIMSSAPAVADSSGPQLASYYERHMALLGGVAHGWVDRGAPTPMRTGVRQVGVSQDEYFGLLDDGQLVSWDDKADAATTVATGVAAFACGQSGWFAIDRARVLWQGGGKRPAPMRVADDVVEACIGDSADYYIRRDGTLWVQGLAHRGQYGDGRLSTTAGFVSTARDAVAVRAHTGHALYLSRDGVVMGTGGNRYGPLSTHGLGDMADRWGRVFDGARSIATGSRHSVAIRNDGTLWAWGEGFGTTPRALVEGIVAAAAGNTATIALRADGSLLQWDGGVGPRRLRVQ